MCKLQLLRHTKYENCTHLSYESHHLGRLNNACYPHTFVTASVTYSSVLWSYSSILCLSSALSHCLCVIWALLPAINLRSFVRSRCKNWTSYVMVHSVIGCNLGCRCDEYRNTQVRSSPTTQLATAHVREHCIYFS